MHKAILLLLLITWLYGDGKKETTPFDASIWNICWNGTYFDFTQGVWEGLSAPEKMENARKYQEWYAKWKGEMVEKDMYAGGSKFRMVLIPPGKYWMGSPESEKDRDSDEKQHKVIISKAFWLGKYEVTQKQWYEVTGEKSWQGKDYMQENENHAAAYISWEDVEGKFLRKLGRGYNFPTEGQWEYACRGGTNGRFFWGESESAMGEYANVADRTLKNKHNDWSFTPIDVNDRYEYIAPIGSFKANGYGLHDMTGNVWEWCRDWKGDYATGEERDPIGANNGTDRVDRGGSWSNGWLWIFRAAYRRRAAPDGRYNDLGFRLFFEASL